MGMTTNSEVYHFDVFLHDALCQISAACLNEFPKWLSTVAGRFSVDITFWHAGENLARLFRDIVRIPANV